MVGGSQLLPEAKALWLLYHSKRESREDEQSREWLALEKSRCLVVKVTCGRTS